MRPNHMSLISLTVLVFLLGAGCASTRMTSQVNPEIRSRQFETVLVLGNFQGLNFQQLSETRLSSAMTSRFNIKCLRACDVFFPGEFHSSEEMGRTLRELGVDAVLSIQGTGSGTTSTYIPQTAHTTGSASVYGNTITGSSTTRNYGGYNVAKPFAGFMVTLRAVPDGTIAWYAMASSSGNAFASWEDLIGSACSKTVERMAADGLWR